MQFKNFNNYKNKAKSLVGEAARLFLPNAQIENSCINEILFKGWQSLWQLPTFIVSFQVVVVVLVDEGNGFVGVVVFNVYVNTPSAEATVLYFCHDWVRKNIFGSIFCKKRKFWRRTHQPQFLFYFLRVCSSRTSYRQTSSTFSKDGSAATETDTCGAR